MTFFDESFFRNYKTRITESQLNSFSATESFSRRAHTDFDIFLSYNFADRSVVLGIYYYLRSKGYSVYVDFIIDPQLDRSIVTKETAQIIHDRLLHSKSLIYADSPNASLSKWMPWELGIVDGRTRKCAILPVVSFPLQDKRRQEYLSVYPTITRSSLAMQTDMIVELPEQGKINPLPFNRFLGV